MLITVLTAFSTMVGRGCYVTVGAERHYPSLFSVVIGSSAKARKGTSLAAVRPILDACDDPGEPFMGTRVRKGFQFGEALIQAVSDLCGNTDQRQPSGVPPKRIPDQRLLIIETEYAKMLTVAQRQGAIFSATLRAGWDG